MMAAETPRVAPFESCIACYKGDVTTGVAVQGEVEFLAAALHKLAGLPLDEAAATAGMFAEDEMGCDPGMVPVGEVTVVIRLCRECAEQTGTQVGEISEDERGPSSEEAG